MGGIHPGTVYSLVTAAIVMVVYAFTLAPDLTWANASTDGGELITAAVTLGIPHPPGYPVYVILGKIFSFLPIGTVAYRFNLFSAVCAAIAIGLLVSTILRLTQPSVRPVTAGAVALLLAFTPLVWGQAVVAEVYALNLLVVSAFLLIVSRRGAGLAGGFLLGLAIITHLTSVILLLPAFLLPVPKNMPRFITGMVMGFSPLIILPLLASGVSPVVWGNPTSLNDWWWLVSGQIYRGNFQGPDFQRLLAVITAIVSGPFLLIGGKSDYYLLNIPRRLNISIEWRIRGTLTVTALLYFAFAISYRTPDSPVLVLPGLLIMAIVLAPALRALRSAALIFPLALLLLVFPAQNLSQEPSIRPLAESVLQAAPEGAILLTPGDRTIFTLWYFQHVEHLRPDLYLVDRNLFAFDWYRARLAVQYPELWLPAGDDLPAFHENNSRQRSFCEAGLANGGPAGLTAKLIELPPLGDYSPWISCLETNL
jgi:hypothetical protein